MLPNGASIHVERVDGAKSVSVQLIASLEGVTGAAATHGHRHLLEHLLAKGPGKTLDKLLEVRGMLLTATTTRDSMAFEVTGAPETLGVAIEAVGRLLKPLEVTQEEVDREGAILEEELALTPWTTRLSSAAWAAAFGEAGLDPLGSPEGVRSAKPEDLTAVQRAAFAPSQIAVAVAGPVDVDSTMTRVRALLSPMHGTKRPTTPERVGKRPAGAVRATGVEGEARGALIPGLGDPMALPTLAAGLALQSAIPESVLVYTPSARPGMAVLCSPEVGALERIEELSEGEKASLFETGRSLVKGWLRGNLASPSRSARMRGLMLLQAPGADIGEWLGQADRMTYAAFSSALARYGLDQATVVEGRR